MNVDEVTERYYRRLFILPKWHVLLGIYLFIVVLVGVINAFPLIELGEIFYSVLSYLIIGISLLILFSFLLLTKVLSPKKVLGLATVMFIASLPAELVFFRLTGLRGTGILAGTGFILVAITAFIHPILAFLSASVLPFLAFYGANVLLGHVITPRILTGALVTELISLSAGTFYILYFEVKGRRSSGVSPTWLLRSFLKTWFTDEPEALETVFSKLGRKENVRVKVLSLRRKGRKPVVLVFPSIHYGPFKKVGSSRFIYQLEEKIGNLLDLMVFHTAGSHEHNVTSSAESGRLASRIAKFVLDAVKKDNGEGICEPYRVAVDKGWEALSLPTPSSLFMFIVNKESGNDDLPAALWEYLEAHSHSPRVIGIADSHSFKGPKVMDLEVLKPLVETVLQKYNCREGERFLVGYGEAEASSKCRSLCNEKVKALTINLGGKRYLILYIYGNNMRSQYRLKLEEIAKKFPIDDVEIVTPDDHSCAASFREAPYDVVDNCPPLTAAVEEAIKRAIEDEVEAEAVPAQTIIKGVPLATSKIFDLIEELAVMGSTVEKGLVALLIIINLAPIVLYLSIFS